MNAVPFTRLFNEWRVGILINLLDTADELVCGLSPVVVLHRDHEHCFDFGGNCGGTAQSSDQGKSAYDLQLKSPECEMGGVLSRRAHQTSPNLHLNERRVTELWLRARALDSTG
jgi:hypothetical protein